MSQDKSPVFIRLSEHPEEGGGIIQFPHPEDPDSIEENNIDDMPMDQWASAIDANNEYLGWNTKTVDEVLSKCIKDGILVENFHTMVQQIKLARTEDQWAILAVTEIAEAYEEHRNGKPLVYDGENGKPEGLAIEYADALIRILHWFARHNLSASRVVAMKMNYNITRPYRHGNKNA